VSAKLSLQRSNYGKSRTGDRPNLKAHGVCGTDHEYPSGLWGETVNPGATEIAGQENAGLENDGQKCRAGKCRTGKLRTNLQVWKMQDWKLTDKNYPGWKMTDTVLKDS